MSAGKTEEDAETMENYDPRIDREEPSPPSPAELRSVREQLSAMLDELRANRAILDRLSGRYSMFRFTGGVIPAQPWATIAVTSFVSRPPRTDCVTTEEVEGYLGLIGMLVELQRGVAATVRPRTMRQRRSLTDAFQRVSSKIETLTSRLQSALTAVLEAPEPLPTVCETSRIRVARVADVNFNSSQLRR